MALGPMLGSKSQSEIQKEEESERQNGNDGPAGKYSSRSSGGEYWYISWAKGHRVFSAIHLKTNCATVKQHLGVEWILSWSSKKEKKKKTWPCSMCGPMLKVRPRRQGIKKRDGETIKNK